PTRYPRRPSRCQPFPCGSLGCASRGSLCRRSTGPRRTDPGAVQFARLLARTFAASEDSSW
ncbi:MAG TPA: hypothetical protein DD420_07980, partial [Streptomyces sp.]|nr:hypothetical protein [Streptomyces sp.]